MDIKERVMKVKSENNYCCSETIMALALEDMGKENEDLKLAMAAFCGGMKEGEVCGALAAAASALFISDYAAARERKLKELMTWFKDTFKTWDCRDILKGDDSRKQTVCPALIVQTYIKMDELLNALS
jgi:hypothetical protein